MVKLLTYSFLILFSFLKAYSQVVLEPVWSTAYVGKGAWFMPDGKEIITVGGTAATVWNVENGKEHFTLRGHEKPIDTVVISKSGAIILTLSKYDSVAKLWNGKNGTLIRTIHYPQKSILCASISNNDTYVALGCSDGTVGLWNMDTKAEEKAFDEHFNKVTALAFSATGDTLVSGSAMVVLMWDRKTKKVIHTYDVSGGKVECVSMNNKADRVIAACSNGETSIWDVVSGALQLRIPYIGLRYNNMTVNNKGDKLLLLMDGYTYLIDISLGKVINEFQNKTYTEKKEQRFGSFSPSGTMFSETMGDSVVRIHNTETNSLINEIRVDQTYFKMSVFSPTEEKILTTNNSDITDIWDVASVKKIYSFCGNNIGVSCFDVNFDKKIMVTGNVAKTGEGTIKIWDLDSAKLTFSSQYKESAPADVYINKSGEKLIVNETTIGAGMYVGRNVNIWDLKEKKLMKVIKSTFDVISGGFNYEGTKFTTFIMPTAVEIWDAEDLSVILRTQGKVSRIKPFFMENDDVIAEDHFGNFARYDGSIGQMIVSFERFGYAVAHGFSEHYLAVWSHDTDNLAVFDLIDGSIKTKLSYNKWNYYQVDAAFSKSGKYCIFTESDTNAVIWNLESNSLHKSIRGNSKGIVGLFFTKDNSRCITYGADSLIRIWSVKSGELIAMLNAKANFIIDVKTDDSFTTVIARVRDGTMKKWDVSQVPTDVKEFREANPHVYIQFSPNPVCENLNIHISEKAYQPIRYTLINTLGQEVMNNVLLQDEDTFVIPIHNLSAGMYIFTTEINGKKVQEKFIVMR